MSFRPPSPLPSPRASCAVVLAALLAGLTAHGAEGEINKELLPERPAKQVTQPMPLPKEANPSLLKEFFAPSVPEMPTPFAPPSTILRRPLTRAEEERLDQQRNWIFVTPNTTDQSLESLLGVRRESVDGVERPFKSVLERYLENSNAQPADPAGKSRTNSLSRSRDRDPLNRNEQRGLLDPDHHQDQNGKNPKRDGTAESNVTKTSTVGQIGLSPALLRNAGEFSNGSSTLTDLNYSSLYNTGADLRERRERDEERKVRSEDFRAILEGRHGIQKPATGPGGTRDPINSMLDGNAQVANPFTGSTVSAFAKGTPIAFSFGNLSGNFGRPTLFGDAARPLGNSALSPSAIFTQPVSRVVQQPKSAVLEIPRRKF